MRNQEECMKNKYWENWEHIDIKARNSFTK